jgi:hypothetical protein
MGIKSLISRVKRTSLPEIQYRARRYLLARSAKKKKALIVGSVPRIDWGVVDFLELPEFDFDADTAEGVSPADNFCFSLNADPNIIATEEQKNGLAWHGDLHSQNFDLDIRQIWEKGRLQHLTLLLLGEDAKKTELAKRQCINWLHKNPFLLGPHYMSPMECGLRIPAFFYALKCIKDWPQTDWDTLADAVYRHSWWVSRNLALYSSLGNHTVCECIGLVFGGAVYRETEEGKKWLSRGCTLLEKELSHQILDDGGPAEQSMNYHRFVLDLYWLACGFLEKNRLYDCSKWKTRLVLGENFLENMEYSKGLMPNIGDSDDGCVVAPGVWPRRPLGIKDESLNQNLGSIAYPESGYTVITKGKEFFLTFDHGSLGMAPLYGHGHADALSITLYINEQPFLIDPGTFLYNGDPALRTYFKGTSAHNTVCIDGQDQAVQETGFVWAKPYKAEALDIKSLPGQVWKLACHHGYQRLKDSVFHYRALVVHPNGFLLVVDHFSGTGTHEYELNYHLDPGVGVADQDQWLRLSNREETLFLNNPGPGFALLKGNTNPLSGWFSPAYGILEKTVTLKQLKKGFPSDVRFVSLFCKHIGQLEQAIEFQKITMEILCSDILS